MVISMKNCLFIDNNDNCQHRDLLGLTCAGECGNYCADTLSEIGEIETANMPKNGFIPTCKRLHFAGMKREVKRIKRTCENGGL
jgi:hypothetical protein